MNAFNIHKIFYGSISADYNPVFDREELHHILKVRRIRTGEEIYFTDGKGNLYRTSLLSRKGEFSKAVNVKQESPPQPVISVFCGIIQEPARLGFLVEKATELGVTSISFVNFKRCVKTNVKIDKLNRVAISAIKQSGNLFLPQIASITFEELQQTCKNTFSMLRECPL